MRSKKLTLSFSLIVVLSLVLGFALPCVFVNSEADNVAYAAAGNYYAGITATKGTALLGQLHDLIVSTHHTYTSYDDCKSTKVNQTDPGPNGVGVMEFYTQQSITKFSGTLGTWNREHVWCQSLSNGLWGTGGGGSDMHHIRPSEGGLNSIRGNNKYGEVGSGAKEAWSRDSSGKNVALGGHYVGSSTFEPLDNVKGDVARIVMYVYTHYNNASNVGGTKESAKTHGNLPITNVINASSDSAAWQMLLKWNKLDPVDSIERTRNEAVYGIQGNRNPFIDNEMYADAIWGDGTSEQVELQSLTLNQTSFTLTVGQTQTLSVTATPSNANAAVTWSTSNASVATVNNGVVTAKSNGTATITATSVANANIKATAAVTVRGVTSIEITGEPSKKIYQAGQTFDPTGLTVKLIYSDGSSQTYSSSNDLTRLFSWYDANTGKTQITASTSKIKCTYGKVEQVINLSTPIEIKTATSMELINTPDQLTYELGDTFNPYGLTVRIHYNDGTHQDFTNASELRGFTWVDSATGSTELNENTTTILCQKDDLSVISTWSVTIRKLVSIEILGTPSVTSYQAGQTFDPTGLTVCLTYNDNTTRELNEQTALQMCEWVDADTDHEILVQQTTKIKVKYQGLSLNCDFTVTVAAPPDTVSGFINSVVAIHSATTLKDRFDAIKSALIEYNKLSDNDKNNVGVQDSYQTLTQAIDSYNTEIASHNGVMESATQIGAYAISATMLAGIALVFVLRRFCY